MIGSQLISFEAMHGKQTAQASEHDECDAAKLLARAQHGL